jgi:hypothetical protein
MLLNTEQGKCSVTYLVTRSVDNVLAQWKRKLGPSDKESAFLKSQLDCPHRLATFQLTDTCQRCQVMWLQAKQSRYTPWWRSGERKYSSYSFLTSALDGGVSGQRHAPAALSPEERTPGTHCTGGWVGPRAGLDTEVRRKILCPCRGSNPHRPVVQSVK